MKQPSNRLVLIELNEVNFDVVKYYLSATPGKYCSLENLINGLGIRTTAEEKYEEIEPWIQWVSVHTGLSYAKHGIFRLGDIVGSKVKQFFEVLEKHGVKVGSISAMNAENRLKKPAYFIPDPWTKTSTDGGFWSEALAKAVGQAVNDNAQSKITARSAFALLLGFIRFAKLRHLGLYLKLALNSRRASWRKALFLDLFLHDVHLALMVTQQPNFSSVFLNAGAHIQHHYFFNSVPVKEATSLRNPTWYVADTEDPFADMLEIYDTIIGEYLALKDTETMVVTGLSQKPYDRIKYYWRLKDHSDFLRAVDVECLSVVPRMTRDFLIEFDSCEAASNAQKRLSQLAVSSDGEFLFGEIDNRGKSLFVTLTYPHDIDEHAKVTLDGAEVLIRPYTTFVAIKNGMHQPEGFAFFTPGVARFAPKDRSHVKEIYGAVLGYFGVEESGG
jgi:hypothetical protein